MSERYEYSRSSLSLDDLSPSPTVQLSKWIDEAIAELIVEPTAACLSTVATNGRPSSRMVLLRGVDQEGVTFFTNYQSRKGREIAENPNVCLNLWWAGLERQIRIEGTVVRLEDRQSDAYWHERPRDSQLASAASPQSQKIGDRNELLARIQSISNQYPQGVPRPEQWGGYRLTPDYFEFWQGGVSRLHDRFAYQWTGQSWVISQLAP